MWMFNNHLSFQSNFFKRLPISSNKSSIQQQEQQEAANNHPTRRSQSKYTKKYPKMVVPKWNDLQPFFLQPINKSQQPSFSYSQQLKKSANQLKQNQVFWLPHIKSIAFDRRVAFVGGIDFTENRDDTWRHRRPNLRLVQVLKDPRPTHNETWKEHIWLGNVWRFCMVCSWYFYKLWYSGFSDFFAVVTLLFSCVFVQVSLRSCWEIWSHDFFNALGIDRRPQEKPWQDAMARVSGRVAEHVAMVLVERWWQLGRNGNRVWPIAIFFVKMLQFSVMKMHKKKRCDALESINLSWICIYQLYVTSVIYSKFITSHGHPASGPTATPWAWPGRRCCGRLGPSWTVPWTSKGRSTTATGRSSRFFSVLIWLICDLVIKNRI